MAEQALDQALLLARSPALARRFRSAPLPDGILQVLRIAAGDELTIEEAVAATERSVKSLREAAAFYIVQVMLSPGLDSYRTLGANAQASRDQLRTHMVWLLKWLHPDTHKGEPHTVFATRVIKAWESLRTQEARELYDTAKKQQNIAGLSEQNVPAYRPVDRVGRASRSRRPHAGKLRFVRRWTVPVLLGSLIASCLVLGAVYVASFWQGPFAPTVGFSKQIQADSGLRH